MSPSKELSREECGLQFRDVVPSDAADRELRWFFNDAEEACEQPSNYVCLLGGASPTNMAAVEARAEAVHARATIRTWLEAVSVADVLQLQGVYLERAWPRAIRKALGMLAGAVEALPTVRVLYMRALITAKTEADTVVAWLEEHAKAEDDVLSRWKEEAEMRCAMAIRAYERARGTVECVVPEEEVGQ